MARVLLVEDHDQVREIVCAEIAAVGHRADCVRTKAEAEAALRRIAYDVVICDLRLPDGSGRDLLVAASKLGVCCVLMTGHPDDGRDEQVVGIPYAAWLRKPFRLDELHGVIERCLPTSQQGLGA